MLSASFACAGSRNVANNAEGPAFNAYSILSAAAFTATPRKVAQKYEENDGLSCFQWIDESRHSRTGAMLGTALPDVTRSTEYAKGRETMHTKSFPDSRLVHSRQRRLKLRA